MTDSARDVARDLQANFSTLTDVPLDEITAQVKSLRAAGMDDETLYEAVPRMFQLKQATEDQLSEDTHDGADTTSADDTDLAPEEIRVHHLPEKYDRDDWA